MFERDPTLCGVKDLMITLVSRERSLAHALTHKLNQHWWKYKNKIASWFYAYINITIGIHFKTCIYFL